jgi:hypothetical protein
MRKARHADHMDEMINAIIHKDEMENGYDSTASRQGSLAGLCRYGIESLNLIKTTDFYYRVLRFQLHHVIMDGLK